MPTATVSASKITLKGLSFGKESPLRIPKETYLIKEAKAGRSLAFSLFLWYANGDYRKGEFL